MEQIIIHVDMDAFYASVEMRDNPSLVGKPLIIGCMPHERGVVCTCSYEARKYGVRSAMNIKEAYRLCPNGIFMHPNFQKYKAVSEQLHRIWDAYSTATEGIALDEAFLDVTDIVGGFEDAGRIARTIKERVLNELGLSCSVGVAYSKTAAKAASEENKPDGYYEIPTAQDYVNLVIDRDVRAIYGVGAKTAEKLNSVGIRTVRDIRDRRSEVESMLGSHGRTIVELAYGIDESRVVPYCPEDAKSISREVTFQEDVFDSRLLEDVVTLLSVCVEYRARRYGLYGRGVSLKLTYSDMKGLTRSRNIASSVNAATIRREALAMLSDVPKRSVRLIGVGMFNISNSKVRQLTLDEVLGVNGGCEQPLDRCLEDLQRRYGIELVSEIDRICTTDYLHKVIEQMRVQRLRKAKAEMAKSFWPETARVRIAVRS